MSATTAALALARNALEVAEWAGDFCDDAACPVCLCRAFKQRHGEGCILAAALAALRALPPESP